MCALTDGDAYNIYCISSNRDHCIGPYSCYGNLQMPLTPTKLLRPRYTPTHTHTYTWFLFTLAHKHLYTNTEFPLYLYHCGPNAIIFFLHLSFFLLPSPSMPLYMSLCSLRWQSQPQTARPQTTHGPFTVGLMHTAHKTGKNFHNLTRSNMIGWLYAKSRSKVTGFFNSLSGNKVV